ncbi:hypothetical protein D3C72_2557470 [compost metagenome]
MPAGPVNFACEAGPPSPDQPGSPVPQSGVVDPSAPATRTWFPSGLAMSTRPWRSTKTVK